MPHVSACSKLAAPRVPSLPGQRKRCVSVCALMRRCVFVQAVCPSQLPRFDSDHTPCFYADWCNQRQSGTPGSTLPVAAGARERSIILIFVGCGLIRAPLVLSASCRLTLVSDCVLLWCKERSPRSLSVRTLRIHRGKAGEREFLRK